ncbi:MAG: DUF3754 domain-containing protein [Candidatus Thiodiazotropha lotti]|nr:DUF3754 domain-containing protein [Candidatus Thiodiazotropha lotti]MCG8000100.1 DUF3754 domain-containing protein [Candidatus Thiodiazotropha lotti]MCW4184318.1 TMEM143 family protein [Candidatus Thiodiazotropha weberae]MCW4191870.1 TMEM143 family protein [Candidatus Thiodiazotropha weberae]
MENPKSIAQFDHFIPVSTSRLVSALVRAGLSTEQVRVVHKIRRLITLQFSDRLIKLKQLYQPFNPDRELLAEDDESIQSADAIQQIKQLLHEANYSELTRQQIEYALEQTSPYGLDVKIDFDQFTDVSLFYRAKSQRTVMVRNWKTLFIKKRSVNLIAYQRICLLLHYPKQHHKSGIHIKLFKDILRPDLEMLFPDCKIRMKTIDKIKLAVTGGGGTAGGLVATIGKLTAAVSPLAIIMAVAGFAALLWRQINKVFVQRTRYMASLAQNLYFNNLDNNMGAITYLIDQARQEEIKETLLAYGLINLQKINNSMELDSACETWLMEQFDCTIDFDIEDGLKKLVDYKLIEQQNETLSCQSAETLCELLDHQWQEYMELPESRI